MQAHIIHAFIDGKSGGNPAGLVLDADHLSVLQMQEIATIMGLSETAFVQKSKKADFKLLFFTPTKQIGDCGHATVATFSYLKEIGRITGNKSSKETIVGVRDIYLDGNKIAMQQSAPSFIELNSTVEKDVLGSLDLNSSDLLSGFKSMIVNTEENFMIVPLKDEATVLKSIPNQEKINSISHDFNLVGYYIFSRQAKIKGRNAGTRMFAPRYGIDEESATGMAAGPLASYLYQIMGIKKSKFQIEQGHLMSPASASLLEVEVEFSNSVIKQLIVGGRAQLIKTISL